MNIQNNNKNYSYPSFKSHIPRTFGGVMNYMYKNAQKINPDVFECQNTIKVSTTLKNGVEASGSVNFLNDATLA